jgi:hypothetical protein
MALLPCADCHRMVSSEAIACPNCGRPMRDTSYLTPGAQALVGAVVLVACLAWPPLLFIVFLILVGRFISRARRRSKGRLLFASGVVVAFTLGLGFLLASPGAMVVVLVIGAGTLAWLVAPLLRSAGPRRWSARVSP